MEDIETCEIFKYSGTNVPSNEIYEKEILASVAKGKQATKALHTMTEKNTFFVA